MGVYFIGVDYGTVHTKVCVREDVAPVPSAVVVSPSESGVNRFLIPSTSPDWDGDAPKIILCSKDDNEIGRDTRALAQLQNVLTRAIRAAVEQVDAQTPSSTHKFIVQFGFPSAEGIDAELAETRYGLAIEQAVKAVQDPRVQFEKTPLDERTATLALLERARYEFDDEALLVVDAGGWTTHASFIRWVKDPPGFSIHGYETVLHGIQSVVRSIRYSLKCSEHEAERALDGVMRSVYASTGAAELNLSVIQRNQQIVSAAFARAMNLSPEEAKRRVRHVLHDLQDHVEHVRVEDVYLKVWEGGWRTTPGSMHYTKYRLVLLGGASRIGRASNRKTIDPLALKFKGMQDVKPVHFTGIVYPELEREFWAFEPAPHEDAVPYLFVAGGYTWPQRDWPDRIKRTVLELRHRREPRPWEDPENEPG